MILKEVHLVSSHHIKLSFVFVHNVTRDTIFTWLVPTVDYSFTEGILPKLQIISNRCLTSLAEWPFVEDRVLLSMSDSTFGIDFPSYILNISSKSALFLLSSNVQRPSCFNLSLYGICFIPGTFLVNQCRSFSNMCLSLT